MFLLDQYRPFFKVSLVVLTGLIIFSPKIIFGAAPPFSKERKVVTANVIGISTITAWGIVNWDYFDTGMNSKSEGWFSENTKYGGSDKLGHFYISYSTSHLFSSVFEGWGYSRERGAFLGSLSSFTVMSWMEIGDSFSRYGFSCEDFIMNSVGCLTGYFMAVSPELSRKIDLRAEYLPDFKSTDFFTDYDNIKFLIALKLDGFECVQNRVVKYLEFHLGYYTRDYPDCLDKKRNIYLGLGVNMSRLFNHYSMRKTAKLSNYLQVPYTYISYSHNLNQ